VGMIGERGVPYVCLTRVEVGVVHRDLRRGRSKEIHSKSSDTQTKWNNFRPR
jgi:hypothetical protein